MTSSEVRIELPTGGYAPLIHCETSVPERVPLESVTATPVRKNHVYPILGAFVIISLCVSLIALAKTGSDSSLDSLWKPFVQNRAAVLISLPAPNVYEIKGSAYSKLQDGSGVSSIADIQKRESYYVGVGAAEGAARFGEQLGHRNKAFVTKFGKTM